MMSLEFFVVIILPVDSADNLTTFMGRLSRNLETSTSWNFLCPSQGFLYRLPFTLRFTWTVYGRSIEKRFQIDPFSLHVV